MWVNMCVFILINAQIHVCNLSICFLLQTDSENFWFICVCFLCEYMRMLFLYFNDLEAFWGVAERRVYSMIVYVLPWTDDGFLFLFFWFGGEGCVKTTINPPTKKLETLSEISTMYSFMWTNIAVKNEQDYIYSRARILI